MRILGALFGLLLLASSSSAQIINPSCITGTSGATCPLLNGTNTWSGVQTFGNNDIVVSPPASTATLTTALSQASGGTALLAFSSLGGSLSVGQKITGTSIPLGTTLQAFVSTAQASLTANGISASGQAVLTTTNTTGVAVGQQCTDITTPTAIGAGNVILSIQAGVSITMVSNLAAATVNGDTITCDPVVILSKASTGTISAGASIVFTSTHTANSAAASVYNQGDETVDGAINAGSINSLGYYYYQGTRFAWGIPGTNSAYFGPTAGNPNLATNTGTQNYGLGTNSLLANTTGSLNTAAGNGTLATNTTGNNNTAIGYNALNLNTTGFRNVAVGYLAQSNATTGSQNIAIGYNTMLGVVTGQDNIAMGNASLNALAGGNINVAIGRNTLKVLSTGQANTVIGHDSGQGITTPNFNTIIGDNSGGGITTGANNTILGAQINTLSNPSNTIIIGDGAGSIRADFGYTTASNWTLVGPAAITGLASAATTSAVCYNTGSGLLTYNSTVGTCTVSTIAAKNLIAKLTPIEGFNMVMAMEPWRYSLREGLPTYINGEQIGFIAEYAAEKDDRLVAHNPDGTTAGFRYEQYTAALTAALKYIKADNDNLREEINELKKKLH